ncbi:MAG: GNAT family N-acetyltransferase [bacterium]|nr:GNAT family N-acetyltransferase [bacterium]
MTATGVEIKDFVPTDGPACHALRRDAFLGAFRDHLPPEFVTAGAESYDADTFGELVGSLLTFVATLDGEVAGFCTMRPVEPTVAELLYLYIHADSRGAGVGSRLVRHAEAALLRRCPTVTTVFLVTAVPDYNQTFWEHRGYAHVGPSVCEYPAGPIPAVRLEKNVT